MKRIISLIVLVLLAAAGCSGKNAGNLPDRAQTLPDSLVNLLAGVPMKLAFDRCDKTSGYAEWAWEETGGTPKLLLVEIWTAPADVDGLYAKASSGADSIKAPEGAEACYNGRAAYMKTDRYFIRIVTLGFTEENDALGMLVSRLANSTEAAR